MKQKSVWLNKYNSKFAVDGTINNGLTILKRIATNLIETTRNKIDKVAQKRIVQVIIQGGRGVERAAPKMIRNAIEELSKHIFVCWDISLRKSTVKLLGTSKK